MSLKSAAKYGYHKGKSQRLKMKIKAAKEKVAGIHRRKKRAEMTPEEIMAEDKKRRAKMATIGGRKPFGYSEKDMASDVSKYDKKNRKKK